MKEDTFNMPRFFALCRAVLPSFLLSAVFCILFSSLCYAFTASSALLGDISGTDAAWFGLHWWLLAFGASIKINGVTISLAPTLITVLVGAEFYRSLRKLAISTWKEITQIVAVVLVILSFAGLLSQPAGSWWTVLLGGFFFSLLISLAAARDQLLVEKTFYRYLLAAMPRLRWIGRVLLALGALVICLGILTGWEKISAIHAMYQKGVGGNFGLAVVQLFYLPNYLVWAIAWFLGAGVHLGIGSISSLLGTSIDLLPAIPVLGLFPARDISSPYLVLIPIFIFLVLGVFLNRFRRLNTDSLLELMKTTSFAGIIGAFALALLSLTTAGALGAGRMAYFGARPATVFFIFLLVVIFPLLLASLLSHPETGKYFRKLGKRIWQYSSAVRKLNNKSKDSKDSKDFASVAGLEPASESVLVPESEVAAASELENK